MISAWSVQKSSPSPFVLCISNPPSLFHFFSYVKFLLCHLQPLCFFFKILLTFSVPPPLSSSCRLLFKAEEIYPFSHHYGNLSKLTSIIQRNQAAKRRIRRKIFDRTSRFEIGKNRSARGDLAPYLWCKCNGINACRFPKF